MFDTLLFDLDGTLTDPKVGITRCVQYALRAGGIEVSDPDTLCCFIGPPLKEQFMAYTGWNEAQATAAIGHYRERFGTVGWRENRVYDGIPALLQALLDSGRRLAVATSKPTVYSERILRHFRLAPYFEIICGSELNGHRTDKGEVIEETLRLLSVTDRSHVLMIGDREHDVRGAARCGLPCIGVGYGYAAPGELEAAGALAVVPTVEALKARLLSL